MKQRILKSASLLSVLTFFSRILGLIRDSVIARIFGAGVLTDAFMVAFTIPNLLRRLLAEGALSIAFVPVFTQDLKEGGKDKVENSMSTVLTVMGVFVFIIVIFGVIFAPFLIRLFAPGFMDERKDLAILLTRIMFPFIFFLSTASVMVGLLHSLNQFSLPALSPILLNISMIVAAFYVAPFIHPSIIALAVGVIVGGILLLALQVYALWRDHYRIRWQFNLAHPAIKRVFQLMIPAFLGIGVYQINVLISRILASLLPMGSVTYIYYSDRFLELPLGIFAVSIATVVLPTLAKNAHQEDYTKLKETFLFSLRLVFFVCLPAMIGLMVLRVPILALVFQYGQFQLSDTHYLATVFLMASMGIWAVGGVRVSSQVFYAMGLIKETVKVALLALIVNVILGLILMIPMKAAGLTLANALSSTFHFVALIYLLKKRIGINIGADIIKPAIPMFISALLMGIILFPIGNLALWTQETSFLLRLSYVFGGVMGGVLLYVALSYFFKIKELGLILMRLKNKENRDGSE